MIDVPGIAPPLWSSGRATRAEIPDQDVPSAACSAPLLAPFPKTVLRTLGCFLFALELYLASF